ncbi:MAG: glycoside hydrolase family 20 zincin-like fold domain-containing protein [Phycisphaerae bacterium]
MNSSKIVPEIFPPPHKMALIGGHLRRPERPRFRICGTLAAAGGIMAQQLNRIGAEPADDSHAQTDIDILIDGVQKPAQAYHLVIDSRSIRITAGDGAGAAYALGTLAQIFDQFRDFIPALDIEDRPDLEKRGFYLDVSRGKVPNLEKLTNIVQMLAELRYNEFQLYIENVFEFPGHDFYSDTTPLTANDIRQLDQLCHECGIEFVPSLTSLGHFDKILRHPRYRGLAEIEPAELASLGIKPWCDAPWTLCVSNPAAADLIKNLYDAFLPNFSSPHFNICCDESWDLGLGRSRTYAQQVGGTGEVYLRWINMCAKLSAEHGKKIALWGDIILNHPDKISSLPADATLLEWGYEADHPFEQHGELFAQSGRAWYVCPGTSSWQSLGGRLDVALANIRGAVSAGLHHSASGMLLTDWGDYGHQQCFAISLIPLIAGGGISWNSAVRDGAIFNFAARMLGEPVLVDHLRLLGSIHKSIALQRPRNSSLEFHLFRESHIDSAHLKMFNPDEGCRTLALLDDAVEITAGGSPRLRNEHLPDGVLLSLMMSAIALRHALLRLGRKDKRRAAFHYRQIKDTQEMYRVHWHRWNKPSRWIDIQHWFERLAAPVSASDAGSAAE